MLAFNFNLILFYPYTTALYNLILFYLELYILGVPPVWGDVELEWGGKPCFTSSCKVFSPTTTRNMLIIRKAFRLLTGLAKQQYF